MHTATDPELAGYRADIAARGGTLTPAGLPSQPDVPSPFTRRWLFTVGVIASSIYVGVFIHMLLSYPDGRLESRQLRKVVYPTGQQLINYFVVVLVFVLFVIAYVSLLDLGLGWAIFKIFS